MNIRCFNDFVIEEQVPRRAGILGHNTIEAQIKGCARRRVYAHVTHRAANMLHMNNRQFFLPEFSQKNPGIFYGRFNAGKFHFAAGEIIILQINDYKAFVHKVLHFIAGIKDVGPFLFRCETAWQCASSSQISRQGMDQPDAVIIKYLIVEFLREIHFQKVFNLRLPRRYQVGIIRSV